MSDFRIPPTYVDIHVLQTLPPSNVNRDDTGSPKHAVYGGVRRARVSSQAWKRATRLHLAASQPTERLGTRTRRLASMVARELAERTGIEAEAAERIGAAAVGASGITMDGKKAQQTSYLLFFGSAQVGRIVDGLAGRAAELAAMNDKDLKAAVAGTNVKDVLASGHPLDVLLFGRMVADLADLNVDAAVQVAHAISTHAVDIEYDYYTAVDDQNLEAETGAAMIGTVEFNSATLYRYANVAFHNLADALPDPTHGVEACQAFVEAFAKSVPSGHQNTFAHQTRPALVLLVIRDDQPVNLVTAFEAPVMARAGIEAQSIQRLAAELARSRRMWGDEPRLVVASYAAALDDTDGAASSIGSPVPFGDLLAKLGATLATRLEGVPA